MADRRRMTEEELSSLCDGQISDAVNYDGSDLSKQRESALSYYNGEMSDLPAQEGKSSFVSHDLADAMGWLLAALSRVFLAADQVGIYEPQTPRDEAAAKQATDYVNFVLLRECDGYKVIRSALFDGLLHGNGIIKHWWDKEPEYCTEEHTGLTELAYIMLVEDDDVEVLEHTEGKDEYGPTHDVKIKRITKRGKLMIRVLAGEDFGMQRDAIGLNEDDCTFCFHRDNPTRSDLIARGYDYDTVMELPLASEGPDAGSEKDAREPLGLLNKANVHDVDTSAERVDIYECYIKCDYDGDGVAEWRQVIIGGMKGERKTLDNVEWSGDLPFSDLCPDPVPHRWRGRSLYDELWSIQRVKTVLTRKMLDSLYNAVETTLAVDYTRVKNKDTLMDRKAGDTILVEGDPSTIIKEITAPFVGKEVGPVLEYFDQIAERRTGVGPQSAGLDMDALKDQTATATNATLAASYGKKEDYARNIAEMGLRRLFRCLLKLIVANQDRPRMIRLRDQWVEMDPRQWNADMDVSINTGLGSGSRDKDLQMLLGIKQSQELILGQMGPTGPLVNLQHYRNTLGKIVEVAGMKSPELYFAEMDQQKLQQLAAQSQGKPDPKMIEAQQKLQIAQMEAQGKQQLEAQKAAAQLQNDRERMAMETQAMRERSEMELQLAREKAAADLQLQRDRVAAELELQAMRDQAEDARKREEMRLEFELNQEMNRMKAQNAANASAAKIAADTNINRPS